MVKKELFILHEGDSNLDYKHILETSSDIAFMDCQIKFLIALLE